MVADQLAAAPRENQQGSDSKPVGASGAPDDKAAPAPDLNSTGVDGKVPSFAGGAPNDASKDHDPPEKTTKSSGGTGGSLRDQLKMLVVKTPLQPDQFEEAHRLAKLVVGAEPKSPDAKSDSFLARLLAGMYELYAPTDIDAKPPAPDEHTLDFFFLDGGKPGCSVLATYRETPKSSTRSPLSFYLLNTEKSPPWTNKVKPQRFERDRRRCLGRVVHAR